MTPQQVRLKLQNKSFQKSAKSKVDETKTLFEMLVYWNDLLKNNPDARVGSILKYNIERDFGSI